VARWTFVRHGETRANAERWLSGWVDVALTTKGHMQAAEVGAALMGRSYDRYLMSDLTRARQTAAQISESLGVSDALWYATPSLRERTLGSWQGASLDALRASGEAALLIAWRGKPPGAESQHDLALRTLGFLAELENVDTLMVAHGGVIRVLLGLIDQLPEEAIGRGRVANAQPIDREIQDGVWKALFERLIG